MAFFDNLGKKISVVAGTAADKAKDLGEIAKLKAEILGIQSDINAALLDCWNWAARPMSRVNPRRKAPMLPTVPRLPAFTIRLNPCAPVSLLSNPIIPMITIASLIPMRLPQSP